MKFIAFYSWQYKMSESEEIRAYEMAATRKLAKRGHFFYISLLGLKYAILPQHKNSKFLAVLKQSFDSLGWVLPVQARSFHTGTAESLIYKLSV